MSGTKPNFFILGAGKCGTTSLYAYLKQHPQIYLSPVKEPSFFCESFRVVDNAIDYFKLFDGVADETVIGEASHVYFSNPTTARVLRTLFPDARFVVIFRHPADRAYSLYHHMRRYGFERLNTFEKALAAEEKRFNDPRFASCCPQYPYNYYYYRSGLFGEQVQRYFKWFDRGRFHFTTLARLRADPKGTTHDLLTFLGLNTDAPIAYRVHNSGHFTRRFPGVQYLWRTRIFPVLRARQLFKTCERIIRMLDRFNVMAVPPMNPVTREMLASRFAVDLELLERLTGISLE